MGYLPGIFFQEPGLQRCMRELSSVFLGRRAEVKAHMQDKPPECCVSGYSGQTIISHLYLPSQGKKSLIQQSANILLVGGFSIHSGTQYSSVQNTTMYLQSVFTLLVLILFGKQGLRLLAFVVGVSSLRDEHCSLLKERSYTETYPLC